MNDALPSMWNVLAWNPVAVPVRLAGRTLVDAHDGATHQILDASAVPDIHHLPVGCGTPKLTWDPATSIASRTYASRYAWRCLIDMQYGPTQAMRLTYSIEGTVGASADINGVDALVYTQNDHLNNDSITLVWSPTPGHMIRLILNAPPAHPITRSEAIATARSIR